MVNQCCEEFAKGNSRHQTSNLHRVVKLEKKCNIGKLHYFPQKLNLGFLIFYEWSYPEHDYQMNKKIFMKKNVDFSL